VDRESKIPKPLPQVVGTIRPNSQNATPLKDQQYSDSPRECTAKATAHSSLTFKIQNSKLKIQHSLKDQQHSDSLRE
jgi:hypothetical protein